MNAERQSDNSKHPLWMRAAAVTLPIVVVACATWPHLPRGICYEDSGDFQVAAMTLGIPHPPGYAGYVSIGYLLTRLLPLNAAYTINLACLACGLAIVGLGVHLMMRLGAHPIYAAIAGVVLACHGEVWPQLLVPEVYLPSLLLLVGAILVCREGCPERWRLVLGAVLLGMLVANRPPALLFVPVFVGACWFGRRTKQWAADWGLALVAFVLPIAYSAGYFYVRDVPWTGYNYIEGAARSEPGTLPALGDGAGACCERVWWLMSALAYRDRVTFAPGEMWGNWVQAGRRLCEPSFAVLLFFLVIGFVGFRAVLREHRRAGWLLAGCGVTALAYAGCYRDPGYPADLLPFVLALIVFAGVAITRWLGPLRGRYWKVGAVLLLGFSCYCVFDYARERSSLAYDVDATRYVERIWAAKLPDGAVILSSWRTYPPLWYATRVIVDRRDVEIVNGDPEDWITMAMPYAAGELPRAVYFSYEPPRPGDERFLEEYGLYWLITDKSR